MTLWFLSITLQFESYHLGGLISSKLHLGEVTFDSLFLNVVKYKNEDQSNLDIFIEKVKTDNAIIKHLSATTIKLNRSKVQFTRISIKQILPNNFFQI